MLRTLCQSSYRSGLYASRGAFVTQQRTGIFDSLGDAITKSGGMEELQNLLKKEFLGSSDDGLVNCTIKGDDSVASVKVDPSLLKKDISILEKSIKEAVNDGLKRVS